MSRLGGSVLDQFHHGRAEDTETERVQNRQGRQGRKEEASTTGTKQHEGKQGTNRPQISPSREAVSLFRLCNLCSQWPFTGKALRYRTVGDGFIVYSVGIDGEDNNGNETPPDPNEHQKGVDIVWKAEK